MLIGKHCKRNIRAHSGGSLRAVFRHGNNGVAHVLIGVTERLVKPVAGL